ncbi:hypothetical protein Tco_0700491 [Tanacetum coccineum]
MSTGGTIVASHEDVMGFLAKNTTSNNLIRTDFKQKGYFPEICFTAEEISPLVLSSFRVNYIKVELLKEQNPSEQSRLRIFLSEEILEGGMIRIYSAFVHDKVFLLMLVVPLGSGGDFKGKAYGNVVKDKATDVVVKDKALAVVVKDKVPIVVKDKPTVVKDKASNNVVKDKAPGVVKDKALGVVKDKAPVVVKDRAALDNPKPTANVVKDKVPNDNVVNDKVPVLVKDKTMTVVKDYDNPRISVQ